MQPVATALQTVLENVTPSDPRDLVWLFEFYEPSVTPGAAGFDNALASECFAGIEITWLGQAYRRAVLDAGSISKSKGARSNRCTLRLSNAEDTPEDEATNRYVATWVTQNQVEGMRLVVRLISRSASTSLATSTIRFSGRCEKPDGFDIIQGSISAVEDVGGVDVEFPPRLFLPEDPEGRSPADPLNEGFPYIMLNGTFTFRRPEPDTSYSRRDIRRYAGTQPYSSYDDTPLGEPIPMILGRSQIRMNRGIFVDEGRVTRCGDFACMGPIEAFLNFRMDMSPDYAKFFSQPQDVTYHLGEAGGTGTQTVDPLWPTHPPFSYTAWVAYNHVYIGTGSFTNIDAGQPTVAVILGLVCDLPDSSGVFNTTGWTDNGAYLVRHLLTDSRFFGIDPAFIEDSACYATGQYNDAPVIDDSNSGLIYIPDPEIGSAGIDFVRYHATAYINARRARYALGIEPIRPEEEPTDGFVPFDPFDPPVVPVEARRLAKRFTTNVLLRKRVKGTDFVWNTVLPSFLGYLVWNWKGKIEPRSERPADFAHLRSGVSAGATTVLIEDVTPWTATGGLWGEILLGTPHVTSEVRKVTSAAYTTDANAITLTAAKTGGVTVTASGATLSGGSAGAKATGTVTIGGTPAAGNTVTVTINGTPIVYTVESDETTATVAYMVAAHINANTQLRRFISATASGSVVTISSKWGVLTLTAPALANAHTGPVANPTAAPAGLSASGSGSSLLAGDWRVAYANRNAIGSTYLTPYTTVTVTAGQQINIPALAFPAGVTSRDWFISKGASDPEMVLHTNNTSALGFAITAPPLSTAAFPPEYNTTGEELVRVAMSFASNNQDPARWVASAAYSLNSLVQPTTPNGRRYRVTTAGTSGASEPTWPTTLGATVANGSVVFTDYGPTILNQANLTRGNIFDRTYKWPGGRDQPTYTEVVGNYVSAKDDFAASKIIVRDKALRARLGKDSPREMDLTAVDNSRQARHLVQYEFAKAVDHHWFNSFGSNGLALLLEEGDLICASDDSGGHVNVLTQVEDFSINLGDFTVSIGKARLYSTQMFREQVPKSRPLLPSVLQWTATLDTVAQVMDIPVWDEADRGRLLIRVVVRPADGQGDWRGYFVFADAGDGAGYVQIGDGDVRGTLGELVTALPVVSPYHFDNLNSVRVRVDGSQTLTSRSEEEVLKGANLARAGEVLFRFKTATVVSSTDTTTTYDLTGLLTGLYGTENKTAPIGSDFCLLDGTELDVDWPLAWLRKPVLVKVATVNRDLSDTTAESITVTGESLRHPAPQLVKGHRNVAGEVLADWQDTAQGSGGIRQGLRNPVTDEEVRFAFYVMSDDGLTAHYRWEVTPGLSYAPAFWQVVYRPWPTTCQIDADGGLIIAEQVVTFASGARTFAGGVVRSAQVFTGEVMLVFKYSMLNTPFIGFQIFGKDARRDPLQFYMYIDFSGDVTAEGMSTGVTAVAGDEFTIWMKNGQVRYYAGSNVTEQAIPIYTSTVTPEAVPYVAVVRDELQGFVDNVRILRREPEAIITSEMQTAAFGALKNPIRVRVNRISSIVGEGQNADLFI